MKRRGMMIALLLFVSATLINCSSKKSAGAAGTTVIAPDGTTVTSIDVSTPLAAEFTGLDANTKYLVRTLDPSGNTVCETNVFSDNDGNIPVAPYCYIGDKSTTTFATDGRVDTLKTVDRTVSGTYRNALAVETGDYILRLLSADGADTIRDTTLPVNSNAAWVCASNSSGLCARSFLKTASNVYVTIRQGNGIDEGSLVDIYVVSDRCNLGYATGASLQDVTGGAKSVTVTYDASGVFTTATAVWANPANTGVFDVVIDVDKSGTFTDGDVIEIVDPVPGSTTNPGGLCGVGFTVQDPYSADADVFMQIAMDKNRAYQDVFSKARGDDIFAQVQSQVRLTHKFGVKKWIVAHQDTWTNGDALVDVISETLDEVQTGCTNQQRRLIGPIQLLDPGCYDVVFDVDGDGIYDKGGDAVDNMDLSGASTCGFIVANDDLTVTIDSITDQDSAEVKDGTSEAISAKVKITGTAADFGLGATVKAYAVLGSQQGPTIVSTVAADGAYTVDNVPVFSGQNVVKVEVYEGLGTASAKFASTSAAVKWTPGGTSGAIAFLATITWKDLTDMDTHFIKTGGAYTSRSDSANTADCHYTNCTQDSDQALLWTTALGSQTTSADKSSGAIARLDLDCIGCEAKTETAWIRDAAPVIDKAGNFLLCVVAYSGSDTPSAQVSVKGVAQLPQTAPSAISSSSGNDMWFVGYVSQDASGNLTWNAVNQVGVGAAVCKQP